MIREIIKEIEMIIIEQDIEDEGEGHILFSVAETQKSSPDETILVKGCVDYCISSVEINLPDNLTIDGYLLLADCLELKNLPKNLKVIGMGSIDVSGCIKLNDIPEDCIARVITLSGSGVRKLRDNLKFNTIFVKPEDVNKMREINPFYADIIKADWG